MARICNEFHTKNEKLIVMNAIYFFEWIQKWFSVKKLPERFNWKGLFPIGNEPKKQVFCHNETKKLFVQEDDKAV